VSFKSELCVKTSSKKFPGDCSNNWLSVCEVLNHLERWQYKVSKTAVAATNNCDSFDIHTLGWADRKGKKFISTCGDTMAGESNVRQQHRRVPDGDTWSYKAVSFLPLGLSCGGYL
jgi:hypothetical protein